MVVSRYRFGSKVNVIRIVDLVVRGFLIINWIIVVLVEYVG